jgi:hypothetical protein
MHTHIMDLLLFSFGEIAFSLCSGGAVVCLIGLGRYGLMMYGCMYVWMYVWMYAVYGKERAIQNENSK